MGVRTLRLEVTFRAKAFDRSVVFGRTNEAIKSVLSVFGLLYFLAFILSDGFVLVDPFNPYGWQLAGGVLAGVFAILASIVILGWMGKNLK